MGDLCYCELSDKLHKSLPFSTLSSLQHPLFPSSPSLPFITLSYLHHPLPFITLSYLHHPLPFITLSYLHHPLLPSSPSTTLCLVHHPLSALTVPHSTSHSLLHNTPAAKLRLSIPPHDIKTFMGCEVLWCGDGCCDVGGVGMLEVWICWGHRVWNLGHPFRYNCAISPYFNYHFTIYTVIHQHERPSLHHLP
jgi:hypothetical protein